MKIAILSDSHDNAPNLKKALSLIENNKIKTIIHCGDVSTPETLKELLKSFKGKIYIVSGNADSGFEKFPETGRMEVDRKLIAFTHMPKKARELAASQQYDLVFYGHTHKPWEEKVGKTRLVNPGNMAGLFYRASFAIYDAKTDKLELKIL